MNFEHSKYRLNVLRGLFVLCSAVIWVHPLFAEHPPADELADLDSAATMMGSIQSWINGEPEAAIHAFQQSKDVLAYLEAKGNQHSNVTRGRIADRMNSLKSGLKTWPDVVARFQKSMPKQIETELKRQRDAVARYKKSKSPRVSSFAYIPKSAWKTKDNLDVLTASGFDTTELQKELKTVHASVLELAGQLPKEALAKSNGYVRDGYRRDDRPEIEDFVRKAWKKQSPDQAADRIIIPKQSWSNTYGATWDKQAKRILPYEVERLTAYVAVADSKDIVTLHPIRLVRDNYKVNGKRLNKIGPQAIRQIPTNEFPMIVLAKNIR